MSARWKTATCRGSIRRSFRCLVEDIDEPTAIAILERAEQMPGVEILNEWKRVYPYAPHAAHVVGYMGAITAEQLDDYLVRGYLRNERVGQLS